MPVNWYLQRFRSHQDAINKGVAAMRNETVKSEVPYLPINPQTLEESMNQSFVSIVSQVRWVAFIMDTVFGFKIPKKMQREFADVIQYISEKEGGEVEPQHIMEAFKAEYLDIKDPFEFVKAEIDDGDHSGDTHMKLDFKYNGELYHSEADGNGPIDALKIAIRQCVPEVNFAVQDYSEHSLGVGSHAKAAAYIELEDVRNGNVIFGVGVSSNITRAGIRIFSAMNRMVAKIENTYKIVSGFVPFYK